MLQKNFENSLDDEKSNDEVLREIDAEGEIFNVPNKKRKIQYFGHVIMPHYELRWV